MKNSGRHIEVILPALIILVIFGLAQAAWGVTPRIRSGANHTVHLRSDGTIWATGSNSAGQIGDGSGTSRRTKAVQVGLSANATNWIAVAAGTEHTLALKADGSLWAWGSNRFGQLGDGSGIDQSEPVRIGTANDWTTVAAGGESSFALKGDGSLWAWGRNHLGQLGNGDPAATPGDKGLPVRVSNPGLSPYVAIAAGSAHALALQADGSLWGWGGNQFGQIAQATPDQAAHSTPAQIGSDNDWASLAPGGFHSLALKADGSLWAWGRNNLGQLGIGLADATPHGTPLKVGTGRDWIALAAGDLHSLAVKRNGSLWAWGGNTNGQLGDGSITDRSTPVRISILSDGSDISDIVAVAAGALHSLAARADGELYAWGANGAGQLGDGTTVGSLDPFPVGTDVVSWIASEPGGEFTVARRSNGTLWSWGDNSSGQLGDNSFNQRPTPAMVASDSNWVAQAAGWSHSVALGADGTLWAWGDNSSGQLGDGTLSNSASPKQIIATQPASAADNWMTIAAGDFHTLAVKADGTLWAWGDNIYGQLGDGTAAPNHSMPVQVVTGMPGTFDSNWVAIAAGGTHSLGLQSDGTLWAWGDNSFGQLGDPSLGSDVNTPQQIANFSLLLPPAYNSSWVAVAAGLNHSLALQADGTLWAWGGNFSGQLGNGVAIDQNMPVPVMNPGSSPYVAIAAGDSHSAARQADGSFWSWGNNTSGQLANGVSDPDPLNPVPHSTPVRENSNANSWDSLASGGSHTVALKADGSLWSWGNNSSGQLGDGSTVSRNSPVSITEGQIDLDLETINFGIVATGATSTRSLTISNKGDAPLTVSAMTLGDADAALFSLLAGTCAATPFTIAPDGSCTVDVVFRAESPGGAKSATLSIASTDPNSATETVDLSGMAGVQHTLTASVFAGAPAGSGTISPSGTVLVLDGASQTFSISPSPGYHVADVTVDGVSRGAVTALTLSSLKAGATVVANFAINIYTVSKSAANGTIAGPATVKHGDTANYTITPADYYHIADVTVDGVSLGAVTTLTLPAVTANKVISVTCAINTYAILASADAKGTLSPYGNVVVNHGSSQTFTFTPSPGYNVVNVIVDGIALGAAPSFTFNNVTNGNHTIKLVFIPDGDTNFDGKVDIIDALQALRISVGLVVPTETNYLHGDVGPVGAGGIPLPDKKISVVDALLILRKIVGLVSGW